MTDISPQATEELSATPAQGAAEAIEAAETAENPEVAEEISPAEPTAEPSSAENPGHEDKTAREFAAKLSRHAGRSAAKCARSVLYGLVSFLGFVWAAARNVAVRTAKRTAALSVKGVKAFSASASHSLGLIFYRIVGALRYIGASAWGVFAAAVTAAAKAVWAVLSGVFGTVFGWIAKKLKQPLYEVWAFILTPFAHAWGGIAHAHIRLKKAAKKGSFHAIGSVFSSLGRFIASALEFFRYIFNYAAPVIAIVFLISLIRYSSTLQYAISVEYNGNDIGTVENEATVNEAQSLVQDKITFTENDQPIISTPKFSVTVLSMSGDDSRPTSDIDQLSELMIESEDVPIVYAYGLYLNGELFGVYSEEDMIVIRDALNARLNYYNTPQSIDCSFEDDIYLSEGRFLETVLTDTGAALELINGSTEVEAYYTVQRGDSISKICQNLGITEEQFASDNPELAGGIDRGDIVTYHYSEPHLNVICTHYEVYDQVIERTTEYVESSRYEQYCEILLQHGSDGYENVTALVTETNGVETDRTIVSRTVLEEMVPRKFRVGTKENTYLDGDTTIIDRLGTFCWPLADEDCYISSDFGYRSWDHSNHKAIDIAGIPRGTDIYAACDGKVTFSGWKAAYGKLVIIDCGGGYECYYGHCSELLVSVGDRVEKGDVIAEVGMTGSASGNHLHFEMRYDDDRINPFMALGGPGGHRFNMG